MRKSRKRDAKEEDIQKKIERAEKKAKKLSGVDDSLIQRFWEIINLWPKISTRELECRVENFIMNATPGQYFTMQKAVMGAAMPYLLEDERARELLNSLSGKQVGLSIEGEYHSTVTLNGYELVIERGIRNDKIPVISAASRRDYADAVLGRIDPIKLIIGRKLRATHKLTLLKWALPHIDLLRDKTIFDKYLSYQPEVEQVLEENLRKLGY